MSCSCPRPCGKLATATVFIVVGVIQLLVGILLLRSKYANLLSGPDFMTAFSNIGIGSVYGILSSVWRNNKKRKSVKQTARMNVLASLMASVIAVNTTTAVILVLGDGNELLLRHLESRDDPISMSAAFANEVLACAYVTSVCAPIVCIVVAIVAISGHCFQSYHDDNVIPEDSIMKVSDSYKWVYDPKSRGSSKVELESSASETSASDDSVFSENTSSASRRRSILSIKNIPSPLNMWRNRRDKTPKAIINSPNRSLLNSYIPSFENYRDHSFEGLIPRIKESSLLKNSLSVSDSPCCVKMGKDGGLTQERIPKHNGDSKDGLDGCRSAKRTKLEHKANELHGSNRSKSESSAGNMSFLAHSNGCMPEMKAKTLEELKKKAQKVSDVREVDGENVTFTRKEISGSVVEYAGPSRNFFSSAVYKEPLEDIGDRQVMAGSSNSPMGADSPYPETQIRKSYSNSVKAPERDSNRFEFDQRIVQTKRSVQFCEDYSSLQRSMGNNEENETFRYPKVDSTKQKRREKKLSSMESISEHPEEHSFTDENCNVASGASPSGRKFSPQKSALRKSSIGSSSLLRRMWSSVPVDPKVDVSGLIVDEDSLIGLSEEDLLARTHRLRSLSKAVAQRLKSEASDAKQVTLFKEETS